MTSYSIISFNVFFFSDDGERVKWKTHETYKLLELVNLNYSMIRNSTVKKMHIWARIAQEVNLEVSVGTLSKAHELLVIVACVNGLT